MVAVVAIVAGGAQSEQDLFDADHLCVQLAVGVWDEPLVKVGRRAVARREPGRGQVTAAPGGGRSRLDAGLDIVGDELFVGLVLG
ncbi:MAG: hypothetical protein ACRD0H_19760, partial [Actinomycetes bacterium]